MLTQCINRLLFKCHYRATALPAGKTNIIRAESVSYAYQQSNEETLANDLVHLQSILGRAFVSRLNTIVINHRQLIIELATAFLASCPRWMPIIQQDTFREICEDNIFQASQGPILLLLTMSMLTRPLMSKDHDNKPDALRESMYSTVKRLFWEPATIHEASVTIIKAGLFLSIYEYGQGMLNPSYMTMNVCSSMAQIRQLGGVNDSLNLPPFGAESSKQHDILKLWWGLKIHERMLSLENGYAIKPINTDETKIMNNDRLVLELESAKPYLSIDPHYLAYHLQARAAVWLELVLRVVRDPEVMSPAGRLRFQAVDRGLLQYLTIIIGLGIGVCCEAIAIGLNAFVHLHKSRLRMSNSFHFSEQDKLESTRALETMLRILSDFFDDHLFKHPGFTIANATGDSGIFRETFPYFVHMTYVILLEMKEHGRLDQPPTAPASSPLEKEVEALWSILNFSGEHWQIAHDFMSILKQPRA
ncbi:hypothetical protein DPV78_012851 [Talaromyces pinophilus]|nr:hypothetical protein DPV78_012851 [Talaromyces pinophilus]